VFIWEEVMVDVKADEAVEGEHEAEVDREVDRVPIAEEAGDAVIPEIKLNVNLDFNYQD